MELEFQLFFRLILALILGSLLGLEREIKKREAGLQTYSLVTLGAALFASTAIFLAESKISDPGTIFIGIAVGVGFIGTGTILKIKNRVEGVTTAAGLWATAGIGLAAGVGLYFLAILATLCVLLIFIGFGFFEKNFFKE